MSPRLRSRSPAVRPDAQRRSGAISRSIPTKQQLQKPGLALVVLVFVSLQSVTLLVVLEHLPILKSSPAVVLAIGATALAGIGALARAGLRACGCQLSSWAIFFAVIVWSAAIDLVLAGSLVGATSYGCFYMETGEEYFKSSWGFFALLWDGTAHYALQLWIAHATLFQRPCRRAGLFWAGSIINSMPVLLLGGATGVYSAHIKPSTALNAPYVALPIMYLASILSWPERTAKGGAAGSTAGSPAGSTLAEDVPLALSVESRVWAALHALAVILHAWRAVVALGSASPAVEWWCMLADPALLARPLPSHGFLRMQCLCFFFYYVPFHVWTVHAILHQPRYSANLADWSTIAAGGYVQAQFTYLGSTALEWTAFGPLTPNPPVPPVAWVVGIALATLPALFAVRCCQWQCDLAPTGSESLK